MSIEVVNCFIQYVNKNILIYFSNEETKKFFIFSQNDLIDIKERFVARSRMERRKIRPMMIALKLKVLDGSLSIGLDAFWLLN